MAYILKDASWLYYGCQWPTHHIHIPSRKKVGKEKKALLIELVSLKVFSLNSQPVTSVSMSHWPSLLQRRVGDITFSRHIVTPNTISILLLRYKGRMDSKCLAKI